MLKILTPAATQDLTTLAAIKAELQLTDSSDDAVLADLIRQSSSMISTHCRRIFGKETVRETFQFTYGSCGHVLLLQRTPVVEIISVHEDDRLLLDTDYMVDEQTGRLIRVYAGHQVDWWPIRATVDYIGGYELLAELPYDVERCCLDMVKRLYFSRNRDPSLRGEKILDVIEQSYFGSAANGGAVAGAGFPSDGLPSDIAGRLTPYRNL